MNDDDKNKYKFNTAEEQKMYDVKAKLKLAKKVTSLLCSEDDLTLDSIRNLILENAASYFPPNILSDLQAKINANVDRPKTFVNWNEQMVISNKEIMENCHIDELLRNIMVNCCLFKKKLPTKVDFVTKLGHSTGTSYFESWMKSRGYKSKRLPRCTKAIIIEDPKNSLARIKYLQSIEQFRKTGAHLIYIEQKIADENGHFLQKLKCPHDFVTLFNVAVSSSVGKLGNRVINLMASCDDDINSLLTRWILDTVVPQVSIPSVFILEDKHHGLNCYTDIPTMYSNKNVMLNWLELHDVPHNLNMHSAELFELIKKSSRKLLKRHELDENLESRGHKVLRRPHKIQYLNYYNDFWKFGQNKPNYLKMEVFNDIPIYKWREIEKKLIEIERNALKEDIAVNNILENVFLMMKHEQIPFSDIRNLDDDFDDFKMEETIII